MEKNRLIIAAAGAGKTTYMVEEALNRTGNVIITTFTIQLVNIISNTTTIMVQASHIHPTGRTSPGPPSREGSR